MSSKLFAATMITLSVAIAPACATKGFVREEVGTVNTKVDTLSGTVEQAQQRIGQNEQRIGSVDQKAEAAGKAAADARAAAGTAQTAADKAAAAATAVNGRVDTVANEVAASRKLIYTVTLSEDQGNFTFGQAVLPEAARTRVDQMIAQLKENPQNVFIEIEGHTDNVGSEDINERLGMERAEVVKRYLYEQHQVPLHKINVISYGEAKPVAPNNTRDGRAQNRRVVVKVLS
jgi:outer membrane protein OmpA-like peptidoglycan-associated protein